MKEKRLMNLLEKEVDLNKEIDEQIRLLGGVHKIDNDSKRWYNGQYEELFYFAKHFFELGIKMNQKGKIDKKKAKVDFIYFATHCLIDARTGKPFKWSPAQIELIKRFCSKVKKGE